MEVKIVSRSNTSALSLPKDKRFKKVQRWLLIPATDGESFTLVPRMENPYTPTKGSKSITEEWSDVNWSEVE
ncbi:transcription elongation factor GreAB [Lactiplantibacillus songbeiensis]|uniref:Transcription elongation factor GreAB n=1 Tax=Lactiplantibacillus songbeiensis TaxID=2559920 RepID=A0ABW4C098_9LACO|nr:transcription elongation factor GreAB [Lactiplantibacillus songbeiensis]